MIASSSVEKNVVGSLCAGAVREEDDVDAGRTRAPRASRPIRDGVDRRVRPASARQTLQQIVPERQTRSGGRNSRLDAARAERDILPAWPPRASCDSTRSLTFALADGVRARALFGDAAMLNLVELDPGAVVPEHSHPHEQLGIGLSGLIVMVFDGEEHPAGPDGRDAHPVRRRARGLAGPEGAVVLDVFVPDPRGLPRAGRRRRSRFRPTNAIALEDACPSSTSRSTRSGSPTRPSPS